MDVVEQNMSSFIHSVYLQWPMECNILNQFNHVFHLDGLFYLWSMQVRLAYHAPFDPWVYSFIFKWKWALYLLSVFLIPIS